MIHREIDESGLRDLSRDFPTVVCLLVVNYIKTLPNVAINSVLDNSDAPIVVGYCNEEDIRDLCFPESVYFYRVDSSTLGQVGDSTFAYQDFSTDQFFELVKLKWKLFQVLIQSRFEHVIYTDLDVVWRSNLSDEMHRAHKLRSEVQIYIQSFTEDPSKPRLCMGFISFMNTQKTVDFLDSAELAHVEFSRLDKRFGDDDAITHVFKEQNFPSFVQELPQSSFPVGSLLNLYSHKQTYPGLYTPTPKLFHANYVIGLDNKIIMLRLFLGKGGAKKLGIVLAPADYLRFQFRRAKQFLRNFCSSLLGPHKNR